jgi:hypothetical protein
VAPNKLGPIYFIIFFLKKKQKRKKNPPLLTKNAVLLPRWWERIEHVRFFTVPSAAIPSLPGFNAGWQFLACTAKFD